MPCDIGCLARLQLMSSANKVRILYIYVLRFVTRGFDTVQVVMGSKRNSSTFPCEIKPCSSPVQRYSKVAVEIFEMDEWQAEGIAWCASLSYYLSLTLSGAITA